MAMTVQGGAPVNLAASGTVSLLPGTLLGFYVNSTSGGTVVVRDGTTSGGTAISGTITPAVGWNAFPAQCSTGCYVSLSGTINATFMFQPG